MNHRRPPLPAIVIILLLIAVSVYFIVTQASVDENGALTASGSIEATIVNVAPEMAGKVTEVLVDEGQPVQTGDPLLRLDDSLLRSERRTVLSTLDSAKAAVKTAEVALESAQLQYDLALSNALAQEKTTRLAIWKTSKPSQFDQPVWYFSKEERIQAAQAEVDAKKTALDDAMKKLDETSKRAGSSDFINIETRLAQTRLAYQTAKEVFDSTSGASDSQNLRDAAQIVLDEAEIDLKDAQKEYDDALTTDGAKDVLQARADAVIVQELYDHAMDNLRALQTGMDSPQVQAAAKMVEQAQAAYEQAKTAVASVEARVNAIETQLEKTVIYAPMDGIILTRNVEPGEFVQPGAVAFAMANLNELTITVYVPETRLNEIKLGQSASVTIDVATGESPVFNAEIIRIADQAEFTPRNVQTVEGRSSTVYAIKLKVADTEGRLKIGMPADVAFK